MGGFVSLILAFTSLFYPNFGWDLTNYGISSDYYVSSVAVFGNRAFLALPRSSCFNNVSNPTMVEASWYNEQPLLLRKNPFFLESQTRDNCDHLQDVVSLDMEGIRARLWVLDKGSSVCPPKIVIYDLFQKINYTLDAPEIGNQKLNSLLVDNDKTNGARGYVGLDGAPILLVFSLNEFRWWTIKLETQDTVLPISTKFLAFARKDPILFITGGEERGIFSLDLNLIRTEFDEDEESVNVTFLGEKLGGSSGLVTDFKDGLTYYMPQDFVVVRWDSRKSPQAEHYSVLAQSYDSLPYVSQLFTGPQNGIWAVSNPAAPNACPPQPPQLKKRLVKLLKYNIFV